MACLMSWRRDRACCYSNHQDNGSNPTATPSVLHRRRAKDTVNVLLQKHLKFKVDVQRCFCFGSSPSFPHCPAPKSSSPRPQHSLQWWPHPPGNARAQLRVNQKFCSPERPAASIKSHQSGCTHKQRRSQFVCVCVRYALLYHAHTPTVCLCPCEDAPGPDVCLSSEDQVLWRLMNSLMVKIKKTI